MDRSAFSRELLRIVRTASVNQVLGLLGLVNVNVRDGLGRTPLHLAVAFNKNPEVVRALLHHKEIDVNAVDELGRSPLHLCVFSHKEELLQPGAAAAQSAAALAQLRENIEKLTGIVEPPDLHAHTGSGEDYDQESDSQQEIGGRDDYEDYDGFRYDPTGNTGYYEGVEVELARMLMEKGANVNIAARVVGVTPLHLAARLGHVEMVKLLLTAPKLNLDMATVDGHTALHLVTDGHRRLHIPDGFRRPTMEDMCQVIRLIRETGHTRNSDEDINPVIPASNLVNMKDRLGRTALHYAAQDGCVTLVIELLAFSETNDRFQKIDVNAADVYAFTPLHLAVKGGYTHDDFLNRPKPDFRDGPLTAVMKLLLEVDDIDINLQAHVSRIIIGDLEALTEIHTDHFLRPIHYPWPVRGSWNNTALHFAVKDGRVDMVELLLHRPEVDLNLVNSDGQTAVQLGTQNGHLEVVQKMLLHYAAREGYKNVVEILHRHDEHQIVETMLQEKEEALRRAGNLHGIDTNPMFQVLINLLEIAGNQQHNQLATFLLKTLDESKLVMAQRAGKGGNLLHWAAERGNLPTVKDVISWTPESATINAQDKSGYTALHYGILGCRDQDSNGVFFQVLKELLSFPDLDVNSHGGFYESTPLHIAVANSNVAVVRLLCTEVGERLRANEEDSQRKTPLEISVEILKDFSETMEARQLANKADTTKTQQQKDQELEDDRRKASAMRQIEMLLLDRADVKDYLDRLYRDRQMYVDASNSLLVGAALIAGVAFVGWLQPPSGYTDAGVVKTSSSSQCFFLFNALAFFGGVAAVISGADGALLDEETFIRAALNTTRIALMWTISLLMVSVVCVLGAFVSAGIVVFQPSNRKQWVGFCLGLGFGVVVSLLALVKFAFKVLWKRKRRRPYQSVHLHP